MFSRQVSRDEPRRSSKRPTGSSSRAPRLPAGDQTRRRAVALAEPEPMLPWRCLPASLPGEATCVVSASCRSARRSRSGRVEMSRATPRLDIEVLGWRPYVESLPPRRRCSARWAGPAKGWNSRNGCERFCARPGLRSDISSARRRPLLDLLDPGRCRPSPTVLRTRALHESRAVRLRPQRGCMRCWRVVKASCLALRWDEGVELSRTRAPAVRHPPAPAASGA